MTAAQIRDNMTVRVACYIYQELNVLLFKNTQVQLLLFYNFLLTNADLMQNMQT